MRPPRRLIPVLLGSLAVVLMSARLSDGAQAQSGPFPTVPAPNATFPAPVQPGATAQPWFVPVDLQPRLRLGDRIGEAAATLLARASLWHWAAPRFGSTGGQRKQVELQLLPPSEGSEQAAAGSHFDQGFAGWPGSHPQQLGWRCSRSGRRNAFLPRSATLPSGDCKSSCRADRSRGLLRNRSRRRQRRGLTAPTRDEAARMPMRWQGQVERTAGISGKLKASRTSISIGH